MVFKVSVVCMGGGEGGRNFTDARKGGFWITLREKKIVISEYSL